MNALVRAALRPLAIVLVSLAVGLALARMVPAEPLQVSLAGRRFELLAPRGLCAHALLPLLLWVPSWSFADLTRSRRAASLSLRCLSAAALAVALSQPAEVAATAHTSTIFVVDVSDSMDARALDEARAYIARALAQPGDRHVELVTFATYARRVPLHDFADARQRAVRPNPRDARSSSLRSPAPARASTEQAPALARHADGRASDLERALALAQGLLEPSSVAQLALFSDGRETHGSLLRGAHLLAQRGATLFTWHPTQIRSEVGIGALSLPAVIRAGEPFELRAQIVASAPLRARARLFQAGAPNPLDPGRELALQAGEQTVAFRSMVRSAGAVSYRLELTPEGPDEFPDNNHFERSALVQGPPRVLYVEREGEQAYAFAELLRASGFEVDVRGPEGAPRSADELANVDFYVLSDVPAEALTRASMQAIERYLLDGGGFMMAGGVRSFGPGGYQGSLLEPLLPVALDASQRRDEPSLALLLAIDKSGSMAGDKLERAKEAAVATAELLGADAYLGVIGFDAEPLRVVRLSVAHERAAVAREVGTLAAGGGTALFPALDAAYNDLAGVRARVKHVVVLTDGQTEEESLPELVQSMRADGITLSTIGLGEDVHRGLLGELARLGGGRAYFTRDPARVPRLFTSEAELVARSSTVEEYVRAERVAPAAFLRGVSIENAPFLRGYVATRARSAPAQVILASERQEPLLARMRVGLGWSLAFTSDVKPRWSADWYRWPPLSKLLAQLVREHMRRGPEELPPIAARIEGDALVADVDVLDARERFVNGLTGELEVRHEGGARQSVPLMQLAPGRYQARVPIDQLGSYTLEARLGRPGVEAGASARERSGEAPYLARGSVAHPFPAEYRPPFGADAALLRAAGEATGGGELPTPERLFAPRAPERRVERKLERWQPLLWFVLGAFLLDVAARRLPPLRRRRAPEGT